MLNVVRHRSGPVDLKMYILVTYARFTATVLKQKTAEKSKICQRILVTIFVHLSNKLDDRD